MLTDSWRRILIIAILAILSAVISYARGYFESQNGTKLERDAEEGSKNAKKMLTLYEKGQRVDDALWSTQMLLLVFQTFLFGAVTLDLMWPKFDTSSYYYPLIFFVAGTLYALLYIAFIRRLFAALGTSKGRKTENYRSYSLIHFLYCITLPFSFIAGGFTKLFVKSFGIETKALEEDVTQEEILDIVGMGEENGAIESEEKEMIENVLDFTDSTAKDLLTHRTAMTALPIDAAEDEIVEVINDSGYSRIPMYEEDIDHIVGILSSRMFLLNLRKPLEDRLPMKELLFEPHFVPETVRATNLLQEMKKSKIHMSVVVDEYGGTAGIITMEDLLEEIVGNIYDETDDPHAEDGDIQQLGEGLYRIKGSTELEKLCETLDITLPEDVEFDTVAGIIFSQLTVIPDDGEQPIVECYGLHIKVEKIIDRRVETALVSFLPKEDTEEE